jgi:hypothetical protein
MGRGGNPPSPLTIELEGRTTGENGGARKFQREWAQKRHSAVEPLRQFAFNIFQVIVGTASRFWREFLKVILNFILRQWTVL